MKLRDMTERIKIAVIVLRNDSRDGRLKRQISALEEAGYRINLQYLFSDNLERGNLSGLSRFFQIIYFQFRKYLLLIRFFCFSPKLIIAHEPESLSAIKKYVKYTKTPLIYDAHEFYEEQRGVTLSRIKWLKRTYNECANLITSMITVSPGLVKLYKNTYPLLPTPKVVCNAAIRDSLVKYDGRLHDEIGVERSTKILLYQGGLWEHRGIEDVISATKYLPRTWVTVFMGYGTMKKKLPLSQKLRCVEPKSQSELLSWISGATFGVIPYPDNSLNHRYCLPNKLWEFPLAGVPIISRDLPCITRIIEKWKIGFVYCRDGDGQTLANIILRLTDKDRKLAVENCNLFSEKENWEKYKRIFLKIVKKSHL